MIINAKFRGTIWDAANPVATIHTPTNPTISGMPALVTLDKYKHCKLVIDNCAPYEITLPEMRFWEYWSSNQTGVFH
jgi:hypothetical protein